MSLADYQTRVTDLVRDRDNVVSAQQRDAAIADAVARYSVDAPRRVVTDVTSSGGQRIDLPAGFTDDSELLAIEYPVGQQPAAMLPMTDVSVYVAPTVRQIDLPVWTSIGEALRMTYTGAHLVDDTDDTVLPRHREAVACLAASILCGQLASYYAGESEPTISADTVDHQNQSQRWRLRQRDLAAEYGRAVGAAPSDRTKPASVTVAMERANALGGSRLFHPTRVWPH